MTVTAQSRLTAGALDFYHDNGYITLPRLFPAAKFDALRRRFEAALGALPDDVRPEDMDVPHFTDPELFEWLLDPGVLDVVEQLVGPDIALFSAHFFCKPPGDGKSVPWHDDAYFWRETISPAERAITVWLALDPVSEENGCLRVLPGSHLPGARTYRSVGDPDSVFAEELDPACVDEADAVPIELAPNECSIHASTLIHGSRANVSSRRRCGFTMRYISTDVRFNHEEVGDRHQIYLARGVDRAGNQYADPTVPNPALVAHRGTGQNYVGARRPGGARPGSG
ncbi:hypothetical protein GCM10009839_37480 [Catenulispora yoronensis]|uniref:Phytanoyl-CoA dioxygenase n=1 Tax=Catenulispora yoronensis TaxID=450799 RepID=A0ABN2UI46_9ACTN